MNKDSKIIVQKREFLNSMEANPTWLGAIASEVVLEKSYRANKQKLPEGVYDDYSASLSISDCSKTLTIDTTAYDLEDDSEIKNVLSKLDLLIDTLTEHRTAVVEAVRVSKEGVALVKKHEAEEKLKNKNK